MLTALWKLLFNVLKSPILVLCLFSSNVVLQVGGHRGLSASTSVSEDPIPCIFDLEKPWQKFRLLDPKDGIPFINERGKLKKSSSVLESVPEFQLAKPLKSTNPGAFDLLLGSKYVALFDDGTLGFVRSSSKGHHAKRSGRQSYMTTIFKFTCDGELSLQLPDGLELEFTHSGEKTSNIVVRSTGGLHKARQKRSVLLPFLEKMTKRTMDQGNVAMNSFSFLAGPTLVSDAYQIGYAPRCPQQEPLGLESFIRADATPSGFNGCGAENGMKWPDLRFSICCNNHDICYDDCSTTWEECNGRFRDCNHGACKAYYPLTANASWISVDPALRWGCDLLADAYGLAVNLRFGAWAFNATTMARCECKCPESTIDCGKYCMKDCHPINEDAEIETKKKLHEMGIWNGTDQTSPPSNSWWWW